MLLHEYRKLSTQAFTHHISRTLLSDVVAICGGLCLSLVYSPQKTNRDIIESLFGREAPSPADLANFIAEVIRDMDKLGFTKPRDLFWLTQVKGALDAAGNFQQKCASLLLMLRAKGR